MKNYIFKIKNLIQRIYFKIIIILTRYKKIGYGITQKRENNSSIIVSLTSYEKRFSTLDICIKSLLCQSLKPDRVILYLSDSISESEIPIRILKLRKNGLEIRYVKKDLRPHKKYYYSFQEFPNDIVITVDDDVIYSKKLIENLYKTHLRFPKCIVAARAREIVTNDMRQYKSYGKWPLVDAGEQQFPSMRLIATGVGGVLYPPKLLNYDILLNLKMIKKYIRVDDLWLKANELMLNIPTVLCEASVDKKRIEIPTAQKVGLFQKNGGDNLNDLYWKELNDDFNLIKKLS